MQGGMEGGACVAGAVCARGMGMCGRLEVCMAGGACMAGDRGVCSGGMHCWGHAWHRGVHGMGVSMAGRECVEGGVCVVGGVRDKLVQTCIFS